MIVRSKVMDCKEFWVLRVNLKFCLSSAQGSLDILSRKLEDLRHHRIRCLPPAYHNTSAAATIMSTSPTLQRYILILIHFKFQSYLYEVIFARGPGLPMSSADLTNATGTDGIKGVY